MRDAICSSVSFIYFTLSFGLEILVHKKTENFSSNQVFVVNIVAKTNMNSILLYIDEIVNPSQYNLQSIFVKHLKNLHKTILKFISGKNANRCLKKNKKKWAVRNAKCYKISAKHELTERKRRAAIDKAILKIDTPNAILYTANISAIQIVKGDGIPDSISKYISYVIKR